MTMGSSEVVEKEQILSVPTAFFAVVMSLHALFLDDQRFLFVLLIGLTFLAARHRYEERGLSFLFGFLIPLAPALGHGVLLLCSCWYFLLYRGCRLRIPVAAAPFLLLYFVWSLTYLLTIEGQWENILVYLSLRVSPSGGGILSKSIQDNPLLAIQSLRSFLVYLILFILFVFFNRRPDERSYVWKGLLYGTCVAAAATLCMSYVGFSWLPQSNIVWQSLGRNPGTFSDPNAMGIFSSLLLLVSLVSYARYREPKDLLVCGAALVCGVLSGSRSFFLGPLLAVLFLLRKQKLLYVGVACVLMGSAVIALFPDIIPAWAPLGMQRLAQTLNPDTMMESLFSRKVFFGAAWNLFVRFPFIGVGPERFTRLFPDIIKEQGIALGTWTDNANNFYLSILATLGLLGVFSVYFFFKHIRRRPESDAEASQIGLYCLLILFVIGPHLQFEEVAILTALLLARGFTMVSSRGSLPTVLISLLFFALIPIRGMSATYGLYPWEHSASGQLVRWLAPEARFYAPCSADKQARFYVQSHDPSIHRVPLELLISGTYDRKHYVLHTNEKTEIVLSCSGHDTSVMVRSSHAFVPHGHLSNNDYRRLSVQLIPESDSMRYRWIY